MCVFFTLHCFFGESVNEGKRNVRSLLATTKKARTVRSGEGEEELA